MSEIVQREHSLRVLHIIPSFYPATYFGGPIFSTYGLCNAMVKTDNVELKVLTTDSAGPANHDRVNVSAVPTFLPQGYEVYYCRKTYGKDISPEMFWRLLKMVRWADVVHLTGVYSPSTIPTLLVCRLLGQPIVWSPRGSLQRWKGSTRIGVKSLWEATCNRMLQSGSAFLHVTSQEEANASGARMTRAQVVLIPNGVDVPDMDAERNWCPSGKLRVLYLGRLHPIKGIENLLVALSAPELSETLLTVRGEGDFAYQASLEKLVSELGIGDRVTFAGKVTNDMKKAVYAGADVCVIPSFVENFGMVVADSLAHGVPVIVSKGAPWSGVETHGCGWWINNSPEEIASTIQEVTIHNLAIMGTKGRSWMKEEFSWDDVAQKMLATYQSLIIKQ